VLALFAAGVAYLVVRVERGPGLDPVRARIVALAQSQVGYRTDPSTSYCNKFSAYWDAGTANCGNHNRAEEWCADFAAWAWKEAGAVVDYELAPGYLNADSASFYVWGERHGTWHPVASHYTPQPGDVAVYGLDTSAVTAVHVAVVTAATSDPAAPDVVNGDGDRTGFSVVEAGTAQAYADAAQKGAPLSGYVSPTEPSPAS
jgi:CHAP domain